MILADKEITDKKEINKVLSEGVVLHLAMVDENNFPYLLPLNYGFDGSDIYFHCALVGKKIDVLKNNPNVCFEVTTRAEIIAHETACGYNCDFKSVVGTGIVKFLEDTKDKTHGLTAIMRQYGSDNFNFPEKALEKTLVVRIEIKDITGKARS